MKFSTGSSSSSLASDSLSRKSTLCIYTEVDTTLPPPVERMDSSSEAMELRRELDAVRSALQQQSESVLKQRHQLVEASQALAARDKEAIQERRLRQDQLAIVLRSLVLLESRLSREKKQINVSLKQKEKIIKSQQEEIVKLKARKSYCSNCQQILGFTSEQTNIETDPEFQSLESTDSRFQNSFVRSCSYRERKATPAFQKNTRLSKSFQLPKNDIVYGNSSSSEEGNTASVSSKGTFIKNKQVFVRRDVFRRSRKYSGRKSNGKNNDNLQKNVYNNQVNSSSAEECISMPFQVNHEDTDITANQIANDIRRASMKIDQLIGEAAKKDSENTQSDSDRTYSTKMERIRGIKRQASDEIKANRQIFLSKVLSDEGEEKPWYCNVSDPEQENDCLDQRVSLNNAQSKSTDDILMVGLKNGILNAEVISAKNEVLCNNILKNSIIDKLNSSFDDKNNNTHDKDIAAAEVNENWYASTSDADDTPPNEIYKNNPVLECVNQILLQNSLDDSSNDNSKSSETPSPSPKATTKRVQFSTLNSISYDDKIRANIGNNHTLPRSDKRANKIVKFSLETASEHSYEVPNTAQGFQYEIQSIYSNEYEPIITKSAEQKPSPVPRMVLNSERSTVPKIKGSIVKNIAANIESRHLMNTIDPKLDSNLGSMKIFNKRKVPRTPPALPPKPKNLSAKWKAENSVRPAIEPLDSDAVAANQRVADVKTRNVGQVATLKNIEPDYCSISEINVPVVSNGKREILLTQPTVEIHNEQYPIHITSQRNSVAKVVSLPRIQNKISDKDIPKLPHVTEIIIPDEDEKPNEEHRPFNQTTESYLANFSMHVLQPKLDPRGSIQMGNTVSSILSEINKGAKTGSKQINLTELDNQFNQVPAKNIPEPRKAEYLDDIDKFDLSQDFEEFKIDDELGSIVAEEYRISSGSSDGSLSDVVTEQLTAIPEKNVQHNAGNNNNNNENSDTFHECNENVNKVLSKNAKLSNKPDLLSNIENVETESVRNSDIESSNSSGSNSGSYNTVKCEPRTILNNNADANLKRTKGTFDFFLETSGLSSKSIFSPNKNYLGLRPPSANHKNVLKPKDIKMRVKNPIATNKINEKPMTTAIKYFEPYV
ncbi:nuclear transcription factor Y subunit gamma-like [Pararge aegeria]|uniref:Jg20594 protein n=2 Tax=Pararge aegeria TaxID=116150 RepID=A0A8S4RR93_9NEOP|nr:nuclear transcription factor Y subunit gamma-like [Pararge aegeria]CAH2239659.1 jg20594 [Pararge aegeria aegeria]